MSSITISPKFNNKNFLEIVLKNNSKEILGKFKYCFTLIYSIKKVNGATIHRKTGRYYELLLDHKLFQPDQNIIIILELQRPRIGSYNMSCGPEGSFIIDENDKLINSKTEELSFEKEIKKNIYSKISDFVSNPIIPEPKKINFNKNKFINCNNGFLIQDSTLLETFKAIKDICNNLSIDFVSQNGLQIFYQQNNSKVDEYKLIISSQQIQIVAGDYGGRLYGLISLIHLAYYYNNKIPEGIIEDRPQFKWRGMHLDCSRQYHSIIQIKRLLIYMAIFKLNRFHWHLTDNEAWRLDIKSFPDLASDTSFRGYKLLIPPLYGSGYNRYGGFYSSENVKEIIQFAAKLNIEVMPEIDLPAHSWALVQAMPELHDQSSNHIAHDVGNYQNNTINPSLEPTWEFLEKVLKDISELFSFNTIHVGLDERPSKAWEGSPKILELMKENNFQTFDEVQDYYMNRMIQLLKSHNKRTAAWNEAALSPHNDIGSGGSAGNIDKDCLIFAWEHPSVAKEAAKKGFETVMCPGQKTYFDMAYNNSTYERGICWAATIETSEVHEWQPLQSIDKEYQSLIAGIQGQLWSETIIKESFFDIMINPRLATLSEVAWSQTKRRSWEKFKPSLLQSMKLMDKLGWSHHDF